MNPEESATDLYGAIKSFIHVEWLSTLITICCVLVVTALISHAVTTLLRRVMRNDQTPLPSVSIFVNISRLVIWAVGVSVILSTFFGVDVSAAITALGIGGIALSLGFQDTISNLIGGLQVSIMGIIRPGDYVDIGGQRGIVRDITWRHATILDRAGNVYIVPNAIINKSSVVKLPPENKLVIPVSVTTDGECIDETMALMVSAARSAAEKVATIEQEPTFSLSSVTEFGFGGSIILWVAEDSDFLAVKDAIIRAIAPLTRRQPAEG